MAVVTVILQSSSKVILLQLEKKRKENSLQSSIKPFSLPVVCYLVFYTLHAFLWRFFSEKA